MDRLWTNVKGHFHQEKATSPAKVKLVDRSKCPAFLNLRRLTDDPELKRYITSQTRQLKLDLELPVLDIRGDPCTCQDRIDIELAAFRLGKTIAANDPGWQDALAAALVGYVASHLSASISENIHDALTTDTATVTTASPHRHGVHLPHGGGHQSRSSPVAIIDAASTAITSRLEREREGLKRCAVLGALLNVVARRLRLACDGFLDEAQFREYQWVRNVAVVEVFDAYLRNPSQEAFEVAAEDLRAALASRSQLCVCGKGCSPDGKKAA